MKILTTPEERFANLSDFDFAPHFSEVDRFEGQQLRMHYIDIGDSQAPLLLLIHGEPSWSYLYRKMIPILCKGGFRVIVPDLIGFGRSDKPMEIQYYTYQRHVDWLKKFIENLKLSKINLFCQDWGGLIGLRVVAEQPDLFDRVIAANTALPTGDHSMSEAFLSWQKYSQEVPELQIGKLIQRGCKKPLSQEVIAAYDAPFPDEYYKAGARAFPILVPTTPHDPATERNRQAWFSLKKFTKPFLTIFSDGDPITAGLDKLFQQYIPGTKGQPHVTIKNAGHFLQEDSGEEIAGIVVDFCQ